MLQSNPSNTSFPSQDRLTNELQDYINDTKKLKFTVFVIIGKVRAYIFTEAGEGAGARGG